MRDESLPQNIEISIRFRDEPVKIRKFFKYNYHGRPQALPCRECTDRRENEVKEETNPANRTSQDGARAKCKSRNYEISCLTRFHCLFGRSTACLKEKERVFYPSAAMRDRSCSEIETYN